MGEQLYGLTSGFRMNSIEASAETSVYVMHALTAKVAQLARAEEELASRKAAHGQIEKQLEETQRTLANIESVWESRLKIAEEHHKVRCAQLSGEAEIARSARQMEYDTFSKQIDAARRASAALDQELTELRTQQLLVKKECFSLRARVMELEEERAALEARLIGLPQRSAAGAIQQHTQLVTEQRKQAPEEPIVVPDESESIGGVFSQDAQQTLAIHKERDTLHYVELEDLARGFAHRVRNYLGIISGTAQLAISSYKLEPEVAEQFTTIDKNVEEMLKAIEDFLSLARVPVLDFKTTAIADVLDQVSAALAQTAAERSIKIKKEYGADVPQVSIDVKLVSEAVAAVLTNAFEALPGGGQVRLITEYDQSRGMVCAKIIDNGSGISDNHIKKVFQPYFTTKKGHAGLGLSMARRIMDLHRGLFYMVRGEDATTAAVFYIPSTTTGGTDGKDIGR